jgi:hypothetical protein
MILVNLLPHFSKDLIFCSVIYEKLQVNIWKKSDPSEALKKLHENCRLGLI